MSESVSGDYLQLNGKTQRMFLDTGVIRKKIVNKRRKEGRKEGREGGREGGRDG